MNKCETLSSCVLIKDDYQADPLQSKISEASILLYSGAACLYCLDYRLEMFSRDFLDI